MIIHQNPLLGLILAGGKSTRMNGAPKWQLPLADKPVIEHVIERLSPQVDTLVINGKGSELASYGYPLIPDTLPGYQGPLAGLLAGLLYAREQGIDWVASCPCDSPFLPTELFTQLSQAIDSTHTCATVRHQGRIHGVFGLWSSQLAGGLQEAIETQGVRAIHRWLDTQAHQCLILDQDMANNAFFNINTPDDWHQAQEMIGHPKRD